jgi:hypothetical protein
MLGHGGAEVFELGGRHGSIVSFVVLVLMTVTGILVQRIPRE